MSHIANSVDFVFEGFLPWLRGEENNSRIETSRASHHGMKPMMALSYGLITLILVNVYEHAFAMIKWKPWWTGFSFCAFAGACFECLGLLILCIKVTGTKSAEGISSNSLMLFAYSLFFRVIPTLTCEGYLPSDKSGDGLVQLMDVWSLSLVVYLLYCVHKPYVHTYQDEHDTLRVGGIMVGCAVLAFFLRADLNQIFAYDFMWAISLNAEAVQMMPLLFMLAKTGGTIDKMSAHFVANIFLSTLCRAAFWGWAIPGCRELSSPRGYAAIGELHFAAWWIILSHAIALLTLLDFMYYYVKAWVHGEKQMYLPNTEEI